MERLTIRRNFDAPIVLSAADLVVQFFCNATRNWKFERDPSTAFQLKFVRGNWARPPMARWLAKSTLGRWFAGRRPLPPSRYDLKTLAETQPAELTVVLTPVDKTLSVSLTFEFFYVQQGKDAIPLLDRKRWQAAVDEDAQRLAAVLLEAAGIEV